MRVDANHYRNLNRLGRWDGMRLWKLEAGPAGQLRLFSLPRLLDKPCRLEDVLPVPSGPAGIAADALGNVYAVDPAGHAVVWVEHCAGTAGADLRCGGEGAGPGRFRHPMGLLIPSHRNSLYVADSGNHRVQVFDLASGQLTDIWGTGQASADPGAFDQPWALAGDRAGNVYVVDYGNKRVQKFEVTGVVDPSFAVAVAAQVTEPVGVAVVSDAGQTFVYILDRATNTIRAFDPPGAPISDAEGNPIAFGQSELAQPLGLAADADSVYAGDNQRRRVLVYKRRFGHDYAGEAVGYEGPVASLALAGPGRLLIHQGNSPNPVSLAVGAGFGRHGLAWTEQAVTAKAPEVIWGHVRAAVSTEGAGGRFEFYYAEGESQPPVHPGAEQPFPPDHWKSAGASIDDFYLRGNPGPALWLGVWFRGDGTGTPAVSQVRAEYNQQSYLEHLPAIYREPGCGDFLRRFLALFESFFEEQEAAIAALVRFFDPYAAPARHLPWLASWLALELDQDWPESLQRGAVAKAFERSARRGTPAGLRESLLAFAGIRSAIIEPIEHASVWVLPEEADDCRHTDTASPRYQENSVLGWTTMLAPAEAQGAVVGTTAVLDQSHLILGEEAGLPLWRDIAHQFSVYVYQGQVHCADKRAEVERIIDRGKPAHTVHHLCVVEPKMRVGFQARLGIDTVVAGVSPTPLGEADGGLVLGGEPAGRLGRGSRVGHTTRLSGV
jgi:phage tail-like protein